MINVTKKKMEIQRGPRTIDDAAVMMLEHNRRMRKERLE
jgi:hypothetical protein